MGFAGEKCSYSTSYRSGLKGHILAIHEKKRSFHCEHCDYAASARSHLKRHIMAIHEKIKNNKCELCDFASTQKIVLKNKKNILVLDVECLYSNLA